MVRIWIAFLFCLGCAEAHADSTLVLRWLECTHADPTEFFSLTIDRKGDVIFSGRSGTRELGERKERYSAETAAHVFRDAERLRRHPLSGEWESWLCVEVIQNGDRSKAFRLESKSRAAAAFATELAEVVPLVKWVCPARDGDGVLNLADFCSAWYGEPLFEASSPECAGYYSLRAYADGTIHQGLREHVVGEDGDLLFVAREGYVSVTPRDIDRVLRTLPDLHFDEPPLEPCIGGCGQRHDNFAISEPGEVRKFWDTLRQHAPVDDDRFRDTDRGHCRSEPSMYISIPYKVGRKYGARRS